MYIATDRHGTLVQQLFHTWMCHVLIWSTYTCYFFRGTLRFVLFSSILWNIFNTLTQIIYSSHWEIIVKHIRNSSLTSYPFQRIWNDFFLESPRTFLPLCCVWFIVKQHVTKAILWKMCGNAWKPLTDGFSSCKHFWKTWMHIRIWVLSMKWM